MNGPQNRVRVAGIDRALRGRGENWCVGCGLRRLPDRWSGHGAMMCSKAAAAGRQMGIVAAIESGRERTQREEQNEKDGKRAPHLQ